MGLIDRIRYYDGESLRAFDFGDEQTYHMEMRRRLNRYLHLYGIVEGLNLLADTEGAGSSAVTQVSIQPGLAIDAFGREIYIFAPYTLGDSDITANRISKAGQYDVWLRYRKTAAAPPSSGYGNCNQANQYTRWVESFSVALLQSPSHPFSNPGFSDDDTDDPSQDNVGVLLGTVSVDPTSATATFEGPVFHHRHFLGIVAQRIHAPFRYDAVPSFQFPTKQSAWDPPVSLDIEPNIFARQNLILGPDFDLTETSSGTPITPKPAFSKGPGSAKLAGDLIVQGNIYSNVLDSSGNPQWLGLTNYVAQLVQQQMPEFVVATPVPITVTSVSPVSGNYATASASITAQTTKIQNVSSAVAIPYISQFQANDLTDLNATLTAAGVGMQVGITATTTPAASGKNVSVSVTWLAGPITTTPSFNTAILNFTISCLFICYP